MVSEPALSLTELNWLAPTRTPVNARRYLTICLKKCFEAPSRLNLLIISRSNFLLSANTNNSQGSRDIGLMSPLGPISIRCKRGGRNGMANLLIRQGYSISISKAVSWG
eukprot:GHVU01199370.1.p2 GENE.GHVU01199370.1~~GHVU01199370.1.p2  ORF type:complete len:109 (-),score=5.09 GHVU01199370.1:1001-1327(-)